MTEQTLPTVPGGHTAYGITVHELGEDGDLIIAFGHHDIRRFFAACNHLVRTVWGGKHLGDEYETSWDDMRAQLNHTWATFQPDPDEEWFLRDADKGAPGAMPITEWSG
jgi:hypothetical protein